MVHGWLPGGGLEKLVSICLGGLGVESKCLRQVALVDLSILNFGMMRGKGGGPSMQSAREAPAAAHMMP